MKKIGVLFLCVANSARSQMAEGLARSAASKLGKNLNVQSAGSKPAQVNPLAIKAMSEVGIDIESHTSKSVDTIDPKTVDIVITLCEEEVCPIFLGDHKRLHWGHSDPANKDLSETEQFKNFQSVRDQLIEKIESFIKDL